MDIARRLIASTNMRNSVLLMGLCNDMVTGNVRTTLALFRLLKASSMHLSMHLVHLHIVSHMIHLNSNVLSSFAIYRSTLSSFAAFKD